MKILKTTIFIVLAMVLSGCFIRTIYRDDSAKNPRVRMLKRHLVAQNVRIIQNDDFMVFVLPNKTFFNPDSANFTKNAHTTLDLISELASYYEKSTVSVTGFTKDDSRDSIEKAITTERAHRVVQYLWKSKIDASLMYADGRNASIAKNSGFVLTDCVVIGFYKNS